MVRFSNTLLATVSPEAMTRQSAQLAKLQLLKPGELLPCKQYGYRVLVIAWAGAATIIAKPRPTNEVRIMRRILTFL
jgi:hypothetical protein